MKKWSIVTIALIVAVIVVVSAFAAIGTFEFSSTPIASKKPFYVGVTYCGSNVTEAEQLVDKVKTYTNLFVVQSGPLMDNLTEMTQICDYAANAGLNIIVYYSHNSGSGQDCDVFLSNATARYGSHFLGVYYDDEPGGKMLDGSVNLNDNETGVSIYKANDGTVSVSPATPTSNPCFLSFHPSGEIDVSNSSTSNETVGGVSNVTVTTSKNITYYSNGTIVSAQEVFTSYSNGTWVSINQDPVTYEPNGSVISGNETIRIGEGILLWSPSGPSGNTNITTEPITDPGDISQFEPYLQLWDSRPLQTTAEVARDYVFTEQGVLGAIGNKSNVQLFTSDYGLEWYDYKAGYNVVLGELGWNQSFIEDIDMVRGAADIAGEKWGTMITWASLAPPYLMSGDQMYNAMRQSYEGGAQYVVVFNYQGDQSATSTNSTIVAGNGLLQPPQFAAIKKFWTQVVNNPNETNNVKAQEALVLPANFGGALRNQGDGTWGLWQPDNATKQVWNTLQTALSKYGSKLDVVIDDPTYPAASHYNKIIYWNQTA